MNTINRIFNLNALFALSHITPESQSHLKKVYASFSFSMIMAAAGAYIHMFTHFIQAGLLLTLGSLGLIMCLLGTPHHHKTEKKRLVLLAGFAFLVGMGLGPALDLCMTTNPNIVSTSLLGTAMIFSCFTLSSVYAKLHSYLVLGGILISSMSLILFISLRNLLFGSHLLFQMNLYVGLAIICGFILFDTQLIIEKYENGDKDYIWHCVDLFLDFVTFFWRCLMILAMNEKNKMK
uniref:Transmembrane BAX inhibitor motif-containing protein 6 n=2 Tax=Monodelphis domestica TaxID=13616 RepID=F7GFL1_MONDO